MEIGPATTWPLSVTVRLSQLAEIDLEILLKDASTVEMDFFEDQSRDELCS